MRLERTTGRKEDYFFSTAPHYNLFRDSSRIHQVLGLVMCFLDWFVPRCWSKSMLLEHINIRNLVAGYSQFRGRLWDAGA